MNVASTFALARGSLLTAIEYVSSNPGNSLRCIEFRDLGRDQSCMTLSQPGSLAFFTIPVAHAVASLVLKFIK